MIIGYARVSTQDQNIDMQIQAIESYAAKQGEPFEIYSEKESGGKADRKELENAIKAAQKGNTFVVYKLDRLARSARHLHELTETLTNKGVQFKSIVEDVDTTTAMGKAMFGMLAVFAQLERSMIQERTQEGLKAARKRGRVGGRPTIPEATKRQVRLLFEAGESAVDIAKEKGIARSTVYKILNQNKN